MVIKIPTPVPPMLPAGTVVIPERRRDPQFTLDEDWRLVGHRYRPSPYLPAWAQGPGILHYEIYEVILPNGYEFPEWSEEKRAWVSKCPEEMV